MLVATDVGRFLLAGLRSATSPALHSYYLQRRCGLLSSSTEVRRLLTDAYAKDEASELVNKAKRPSKQQQN
jgi:hypothetical protein